MAVTALTAEARRMLRVYLPSLSNLPPGFDLGAHLDEVIANLALSDAHRSSDGTTHANVVLNDTHRGSSGVNHANVVLNDTHRASDGTDHSNVVLNDTHRGSDGSDHSFLDQDVTTGASPTFADLVLTGRLIAQGGSVLIDAEHIDMRANYIQHNLDYVTVVAVTGGLVVNYLPTATADVTTGSGVVTAGVDTTSDPTITTDGAATFAPTDLVMISGSANDGENDGIREVLTHAGNLLTFRSTAAGISDRVEDWTLDQLVANAGDTGMAITKIGVTVMRCGTDGAWEVGSGNQTGMVYNDIAVSGDAPVLALTNMTGIGPGGADPDATTHIASNGAGHANVALNDTHRGSDGTDHANVVLNDTHRGSDGTNHANVVLNDTHRGSDGTNHANVVLNDTHRASTGIDHSYIQDNLVDVVMTVPDTTGGATGTADNLTVQVNDLSGTALTKIAVVLVIAADTLYAGDRDLNATTTFGSATTGSILASGNGWCVVQTDNTGTFVGRVDNSADETIYFTGQTSEGGVNSLVSGVIVRGCVPDAAAWSA